MMRRAVQAVVLVAALVLTSGCATVDRAGAAAVVDGKRITTEQVSQHFTALDKALAGATRPGTQDQINRNILTIMIGDLILQKAAAEKGIEPNKVAIGKLRRSLEKQAGGEQGLIAYAASKGVAPNLIWTILRDSVMSTDLGAKLIGGTDTAAQDQAASAYLQEVAKTMSIEVAPRFGKWDDAQFTVAATDDLSQPATPSLG